MISEESTLFLAGQIDGKPVFHLAAQIGEIIAGGLACAELCDLEADGGCAQKSEYRAATNRFHAACAAFFIQTRPAS